MKKLDEFNENRRKQHEKTNNNSPLPNGIECPKCGCEMLDSNPMITLTSSPPQKNIHCDGCGYTGYRVA